MAAVTPGGGSGSGGGGDADGYEEDAIEDTPFFQSGMSGAIEGGDGDSSSFYSSDDEEVMEPAMSMEQRVRLADRKSVV